MDIQTRIDEALENLLADIYTEQGINSGDITPLQALKWNELTKETATLFADLIKQNAGTDA